MFFGLFGKKKEEQMAKPLPDSKHTNELKAIWAGLDQDLKDFAYATRDLGLSHNCKIRFNERGMSNLVKQLGEIGYEIRPKEESKNE